MNEIHAVLTRMMGLEVGYKLTAKDLRRLEAAEDHWNQVRDLLAALPKD